MTKKPKALEVKLGHDLGLRQQLVMTPQLQQAVNILKLSLLELEAMVQNELAPHGRQKRPLTRSAAQLIERHTFAMRTETPK
jgi:hypothetical protein